MPREKYTTPIQPVSPETAAAVKAYIIANTQPGNMIFPGPIKDKFGLDMLDTYKALEACADEGMLTSILGLQCERCGKFTGEYYGSFLDVPGKANCPYCGSEIPDPGADAIVVYRREK